jgi:hypothetical protein
MIQLPPGTELVKPARGSITFRNKAWLQTVQIADPRHAKADERERLEQALTRHVTEYLRVTGYFWTVSRWPGEVGPSDWLLELRFDRYRVEREFHWGRAFLAAVTFGLSTNLGAPVETVTSDLAAELAIEDGAGKLVTKATAERRDTYPDSGAYGDADYHAAELRTRVIEELLAQAVRDLRE